jgi:hypothetical protein
MKQASVRKDIECAFSLLKKRFNILAIPGWSYSQRALNLIMRACIIFHDMIIDDERDGACIIFHLSPTRHWLVSQPFFKAMHI